MPKAVSQTAAAALAFAGYTLWVLVDACLKAAGHSALPGYEILAGVGLAVVTLLVARGAWRRDLRALWPRRAVPQLLRSLLDIANNFGVVIAVRHLPLALFYILVFFAPAVTSLLAAVFLRERLRWQRTVAIAAGFAGVLVAVNPLGAHRTGDATGYCACAVCVTCFSINMVWSRRMVQTETPESLTFTSAAVMTVAGTLAMLLGPAAPVGPRMGLTFLLAGVLSVAGNTCFFVALRHAPAAHVSQFHYTQLPTGALVALLVWGERPTLSMGLGAVLIVGAGLYTAAARAGGASAEIAAAEHGL